MKENRSGNQSKSNENRKEQQGQTETESGGRKETIGKMIYDYIKKEIDQGI
ncbi:MAG: hypothetical protein J1E98_05240 [Lachnospiraceae bacterium]|nr:hypothetical protein [Lachnospiraceae bacterium]